MDLMHKLSILTNSAKYDAACTSSGVDRPSQKGGIGSAVACGICHAFSSDGRCISLLKVLMTNNCAYDCKYCVNRVSNDVPRATFTPEELANLTIEFYRRNYIEGLFLSSGVLKNPDYTMERMIKVLELLRYQHRFNGYIHAKTIPGAGKELVERLGHLADRLSVNIELPSEQSLKLLAPNKEKKAILAPMGQIRNGIIKNTQEIAVFRHAPRFSPAGQATQMIIGATPESDYNILKLASGLYKNYGLRRVFYSAYIPAVQDTLLPSLDTKPPLLREHRLYQADFLMRKYNFQAEEILSEQNPNFNPFLDPKCNWALHNMHLFPIDVNRASKEELLRVPGIGPLSAGRILYARRAGKLGIAELKRIGVVLKRAQYFITTKDSLPPAWSRLNLVQALMDHTVVKGGVEQLSMFGPGENLLPSPKDVTCMEQAAYETALSLSKALS